MTTSGLQLTSKELSSSSISSETTTLPEMTTTELQTTSKELSTLASSTETTTPMITTTELQTTSKEVSTSASSTETTILMMTTAEPCRVADILDIWTWWATNGITFYPTANNPFSISANRGFINIFVQTPDNVPHKILEVWLNLTNVATVEVVYGVDYESHIVGGGDANIGVMTNYLFSSVTTDEITIILYPVNPNVDITISQFIVNACT